MNPLFVWLFALVGALASAAAGAQGVERPGRLLVMPLDVAVEAVRPGGLLELRADWSELARANLQQALGARLDWVGRDPLWLASDALPQAAEAAALFTAVAQAVALHRLGREALAAQRRLGDWGLGDSALALHQHSQADAALFVVLRDRYAWAPAGAPAGRVEGQPQTAYAGLFALPSGRLLWLNSFAHAVGDWRDPVALAPSLQRLFRGLEHVR